MATPQATQFGSSSGPVPTAQTAQNGGSGAGYDPAAELQRQMAQAAAEQGAQAASSKAKASFYEIKAYIQENPSSVKVICFFLGLVLCIFSILGLFNLFGAMFSPKEWLANFYNVAFGVIICICDGKESWMEKCGNVQARLFQQCYFLATATGKALFYLYVGTMTLLVLPVSFFWSFFYIIIGSALCVMALFMLVSRWCGHMCGCKERYGSMDNQA